MLNCNVAKLKEALQSATHFQDGHLLFSNSDRSFRIFVRVLNDYDPPTTHDVVEIGIKSSSHTQKMTDANQSLLNFGFPTGYYDEDLDVLFVYEARNMCHDDTGYDEFLTEIKKLWRSTLCACGERLNMEPHNRDCCIVCQMMDDGGEKEMCCICHESSYKSVMEISGCCSKPFHTCCQDTWFRQHSDMGNGNGAFCPMCRQDLSG
jgi:hypothetical protein